MMKTDLKDLTLEVSNLKLDFAQSKFIFKSSAVILTLFDLLLCGTKSSWCNSLKPIQRVTYVMPIFIDIGTTIVEIIKESKI